MLDRVFIYFPQRELNASPAAYGLAYDDAWLTTEDGVRLHGWFVPGGGEITWLWFHGNAGSHRLENLKQLHDRLGVNILLFDYRGYGQSEGVPSEKGTYRDADAALAYLRARQNVDADRIVYFGRSLGAAIAVDLADREPPHGLILESSLPSVAFVARQAYPFIPSWLVGMALRARYDALSKIGNVEAPVLFLHGDQDEVVPIGAGKRLFDAAREPKEFYVIPNAGHKTPTRWAENPTSQRWQDSSASWRAVGGEEGTAPLSPARRRSLCRRRRPAGVHAPNTSAGSPWPHCMSIDRRAVAPDDAPVLKKGAAMKDHRFVNIDGIETRYFEAGEGQPLVLVHGGHFGSTYNAYHWSLNFDELAKQFHVYALDKLGQGFTANPATDADYTMAAVIEHAHGFLRAMDIEDAVLVGHSRGALPVTRIAIDEPRRVAALVILDSNTLAPEDPSTPTDFYDRLEVDPPASDEEYVRREPEANSYSSDHVTDDFVQAMVEIVKLEKTREAKEKMLGFGRAQFLADVRKQRADTLAMIAEGKLKAPTLIAWGFNDPSAPLKLGSDLLQIIAPVVERTRFHVVNRSGHYLFRERAGELNRLIASFAAEAATS